MTDRELLEAAAKAAGIEVEFSVFSDGSFICFRQGGDCFHDEWNPLTDDGDALRLAVSQGVTVYTNIRAAYARREDGTEIAVTEEPSTDPIVATRRAIVRAAAEIGKAMK